VKLCVCNGLVYADDVDLLGDDIETIKKNTQTLIDAGKEVFFLVGWDLRHQVLRPLLAYYTAPDDR
jgi:hypothetical protein